MNRPSGVTPAELALLWAIVVIELVSPIPAALTVGAIWILVARPPAFLDLVRRFYGDVGRRPADGDG